ACGTVLPQFLPDARCLRDLPDRRCNIHSSSRSPCCPARLAGGPALCSSVGFPANRCLFFGPMLLEFWRKRVGVEPTKDRLTAPPVFEVRTPHQGRFSSNRFGCFNLSRVGWS